MSRKRYWLGAAMPLVVALTTVAKADGPGVVLTEAVQYEGPMVSLKATNVTLPELARQMTAAIGCEVRFEGNPSGTVTLNASDVPTSALLSQAEALLGGRWKVVYRLSAHDPAPAPAPHSGEVVNLNFPQVSCEAAAAVVARMVGARAEHDGELTGQVSLVGKAMPVEDAMDAIARAAHVSWRRIYVMKVDALPTAAPATHPDTDSADDTTSHSHPRPKPGVTPFSNHPSATGHPTKFARRDWRHPKKPSYAEGIKPQMTSLEDIQRQQMLGLYGNFFLFESEDSRKAAMERFQSGLAQRLKQLEALPYSQRYVTTSTTRQQFQRLIDDFANLDKDQQKEAQALYDYAKEQLDKPPLKRP